jgi:uncharacterized peroxidase-related enzyme
MRFIVSARAGEVNAPDRAVLAAALRALVGRLEESRRVLGARRPAAVLVDVQGHSEDVGGAHGIDGSPRTHEDGRMFIDTVPEESADGALAEFHALQRGAWGFLPNYAGAFSTRPEVGMAWTQLNKSVRDGMDRRRYEIATIAAARALRSTYCTAAHATFLRDVCGDERTMIAIAEDPSGAGLDEQDRAVYEFAGKVARDAASIQQHDVDALRELGLTDADVADVVFAAAARSFFARVLDGLGAQLDVQTAETFAPDVLASLVVGRPVADR